MKRQLIFVLVSLFVAVTASAYDAQVDGIYYNFNQGAKTATVTWSLTDESQDPQENASAYTGSVVIPAKVSYNHVTYDVKAIGDNAFVFCDELTSVTIPESVTTIGDGAFNCCLGLTSIEIPNSVTSVGEWAFYLCGLQTLTIPGSVTEIGNNAFYACNLTSVTISEGVKSIGEAAFFQCGLTSVVIPESVTSIGESAFAWCTSLESIINYSSVTSIAKKTFYQCWHLKSVTIPSSVTSIGSEAFYNCSKLANVYCYAAAVPTTDSDAFNMASIGSATLHVLGGSLSTYSTANIWKDFGSKVAVADDDPGQPRCATPTISVINGKLHFDCETPDVEFVYTCTFNSTSELNEETANDIPLDTNYTVTVYAKKAGLGNSETVSKQIDVRSRQGDVNQDGKVTISDAVGVVNILLGQ